MPDEFSNTPKGPYPGKAKGRKASRSRGSSKEYAPRPKTSGQAKEEYKENSTHMRQYIRDQREKLDRSGSDLFAHTAITPSDPNFVTSVERGDRVLSAQTMHDIGLAIETAKKKDIVEALEAGEPDPVAFATTMLKPKTRNSVMRRSDKRPEPMEERDHALNKEVRFRPLISTHPDQLFGTELAAINIEAPEDAKSTERHEAIHPVQEMLHALSRRDKESGELKHSRVELLIHTQCMEPHDGEDLEEFLERRDANAKRIVVTSDKEVLEADETACDFLHFSSNLPHRYEVGDFLSLLAIYYSPRFSFGSADDNFRPTQVDYNLFQTVPQYCNNMILGVGFNVLINRCRLNKSHAEIDKATNGRITAEQCRAIEEFRLDPTTYQLMLLRDQFDCSLYDLLGQHPPFVQPQRLLDMKTLPRWSRLPEGKQYWKEALLTTAPGRKYSPFLCHASHIATFDAHYLMTAQPKGQKFIYVKSGEVEVTQAKIQFPAPLIKGIRAGIAEYAKASLEKKGVDWRNFIESQMKLDRARSSSDPNSKTAPIAEAIAAKIEEFSRPGLKWTDFPLTMNMSPEWAIDFC